MKWLHIPHTKPAWEIVETDATHISWFLRVSFNKDVDDAIIALPERGLAKRLPPKVWFVRVEYAYERAYPILLRFMPHIYDLPGKVIVSSTHPIEGFETVQVGLVLPQFMFMRGRNLSLGRRITVYAQSPSSLEQRHIPFIGSFGGLIRSKGYIPTAIAWMPIPTDTLPHFEVHTSIPYTKVINIMRESALVLLASTIDGWSRIVWMSLRCHTPILILDRGNEFTKAARWWSSKAGISLPIASTEEEFTDMLTRALSDEAVLWQWRGAWLSIQDAFPLLFDEPTILRWFRENVGEPPLDLLPLHDLTNIPRWEEFPGRFPSK